MGIAVKKKAVKKVKEEDTLNLPTATDLIPEGYLGVMLASPTVYKMPNLPCQPLRYGCDRVTERNYRNQLATRDPVPFAIFQYTLDGCGEFIACGKKHKVTRGKAFLTISPSPVLYQLAPDSDYYSFVFIELWGKTALSLVRDIISNYGNILSLSPDCETVSMLCNRIREFKDNGLKNIYEDSIFAYKFLITLLKELRAGASLNVENKIPNNLQMVTEYIEKNLDNPLLNIETLAKIAGWSRFHFTRCFCKYYNISPKQYLLSRRLCRAMELLTSDRTLQLKSVIAQCGFTSEAYFCTVFHKKYRKSPGLLRKQLYGFEVESQEFEDTYGVLLGRKTTKQLYKAIKP